MTGGHARRAHTSGPSSNYKEIDVVIGHQSSPTLTGIAASDRRR